MLKSSYELSARPERWSARNVLMTCRSSSPLRQVAPMCSPKRSRSEVGVSKYESSSRIYSASGALNPRFASFAVVSGNISAKASRKTAFVRSPRILYEKGMLSAASTKWWINNGTRTSRLAAILVRSVYSSRLSTRKDRKSTCNRRLPWSDSSLSSIKARTQRVAGAAPLAVLQQGATPFVFEEISPIGEALNGISIVAVQKFSDAPQMHALMRIAQPPEGPTQQPNRPERNESQASRERVRLGSADSPQTAHRPPAPHSATVMCSRARRDSKYMRCAVGLPKG